MIAETETLRLAFEAPPEGPVQWVRSDAAGGWTPGVLDLSGEADPHAAAAWAAREALARPFDPLGEEPLFRWRLIRLAPERFQWLQTYHHLIIDGLGRSLIVARLAEVYSALAGGGEAPAHQMAPLGEVLHDPAYAPGAKAFEEDRAFWLERMADAPEAQSLSFRPDTGGVGFIRETRRIEAAAREALEALGQAQGASLAAVLTAATAAWLSRLTGAPQVLLGWQVSGRHGGAARRTPAMLTNVVPLRIEAEPSRSLGDLVRQAAVESRAALRRQRYPHEALRRDLGLAPSAADVFATILNIMPFEPDAALGPALGRTSNLSNGPVRDLTVVVHDLGPQGLRLDLNGFDQRYEPEALAAHADRLARLIQQVASGGPDAAVGALELMDAAERARVLDGFNPAEAPVDDTDLIERFQAQAAHRGAAIALTCGEEELSFAELDERATRLAGRLAARGAGPETLVALVLPRGVELVVAMLAVLKAGAAFLPLDPEHPAPRRALMLADSGAAMTLTTADLPFASLPAGRADPAVRAPDSLAYVIYTSGSTGAPKGVAVTHRALSQHLASAASFYGHDENDRVLASASIAFDAALDQILCPLLAGAQVSLTPTSVLTGGQILEIARARRLTVLDLAPMLWTDVAAEAAATGTAGLEALRLLVVGGDVMPVSTVKAWRALFPGSVRLVNAYGPTEAVITAVAHDVTADGPQPIGRPLPGRRAYVLDGAGAPAPIGVAGELHLSGIGLARGYLGRPEASAERFLPCSFGPPGSRMYRTGDRARWHVEGRLELLGRVDDQVKVRGFRIEPGEVEAALRELPAVGKAAVVMRGPRLVAYVTPAPGQAPPSASDLRRALAERLPDPMIPAAFVTLEELPLSAGGKLDRRALPEPEGGGGAAYVPPASPLEHSLADLFARLTGSERVGAHDSFFDIGGHSLLGVRLLYEIERSLGRKLSLGELFASPTVAGLAQRLVEGAPRPASISLAPLQTAASDGEPVFMVHWTLRDVARELGRSRPVYGLAFGLAAAGGDVALSMPDSIEALAAHYLEEMRAFRPHGPYHLVGHSAGGLIVYEMARQLEAAGIGGGLVGLIDSHAPVGGPPRRLPLGQVLRNLATTPAPLLLRFLRGKLVRRLERNAIARGILVGLLPSHATVRLRLVNDFSRMFRPGPFGGSVHVFKAGDPEPTLRTAPPDPPEVGWRALVSGEVSVSEIAGGHLEIVQAPRAAETAAAIERAIGYQTQRAQISPGRKA